MKFSGSIVKEFLSFSKEIGETEMKALNVGEDVNVRIRNIFALYHPSLNDRRAAGFYTFCAVTVFLR